MHSEHTGMHRNDRELTGVHRSTWEIQIMSDKGHHKLPINERTSTQLPYDVVVTDVIFLCYCCGDCLNKKLPLNF